MSKKKLRENTRFAPSDTVAAGRIADLRQAAALVRGTRQTLQPMPDHKAVYDGAYDRYRRLFAALKPLYEPAVPVR